MRTRDMHESRVRASPVSVVATVLTLGALVVWGLAPSVAGAATGARSARVVSTAQNPKLGPILVAGTTVYTVKPGKAACTTACLKEWPPVLLPHGVTTPTAGTGVDQSKLGTAAAARGARQITYSGKRLYWSAKDTASGQVHGIAKNKWGKWSAVTATAVAAPTTVAPATEAPSTEPPATEAPATAPPVTEAPVTEPPAPQPTEPPAPKTSPPTSPGTGGVAF
jgi:predicted lipoprotein with Yx(FWY)xxD motif